VPWLGELPYLGALFRTVSYQSVETELVILVTPSLAGAMAEGQVPVGGPGMFTDQPTDRELFSYGMIEVPSYGGHCTGCASGNGAYPPPIIDFDAAHSPRPLITPVPIQELPPGAPQGSPPIPPTPGPATSTIPPHAPAAEIVTPPAASWTSPPVDSSTSYSPSQSIRQVSAQSPQGGANMATQAGYTVPASPGGAVTPATANSTRGNGLFEPQSGLYVPATSGSP
jgi:hypothetical protein